MVKNRSHGVSIAELLVGMAIGILALGLAMYLMNIGQKEAKRSFQDYDLKTSINQLSGELQKNMASGDSRFFAFSAKGNADRNLGRVLIPLPGLCRDLISAGCEDDVSYIYLHYNKSVAPAVSAICVIGSPPNINLVVDLSKTVYGTATLLADGFDVNGGGNYPTGKIQILTDSVVATMDPPIATLWAAQNSPTAFAVTQDTTSGVLTPPLSSDCTSQLTVTSAAGATPVLYDTSKLVTVPISPMPLSKFTGGNPALITNSQITASFGQFPMRLFAASFRIAGRMPDNTFALRQCNWSQGDLHCDAQDLLSVSAVTKVRAVETFSINMGASSAPPSLYEILGTTQLVSALCVGPSCAKMPLPLTTAIPVLLNNTETFQTLDDSQFSLLKQEVLRKVRFGLWVTEAKQTRQELFDVQFP